MTGASTVSLGMAFAAGLVSFASPCVLSLVPSYVTFVTGLTLDELIDGGSVVARRYAAIHASLFVLGFAMVFVALGATANVVGASLRRSLPLVQQAGGIIVIIFGLWMLGVLRLPVLSRERRKHLASRPAGLVGSVLVGITFGAGWTPCVGPVLASILLYSGMSETAGHGMLLLAVYSLGLGLPFWLCAVAFNWYLAGARRVARWLPWIERVTGAILVVVGILLITGHFATMSRTLAGFGQLFNLE